MSPHWRHYPDGVDQADQTRRLRQLASLLWTLGLSFRGVVAFFDALALVISHMTVLRDMRVLSDELRHQRQNRQVQVLGLDGAVTYIAGQEVGMVVAVDLGSGEPVAVAAPMRRTLGPCWHGWDHWRSSCGSKCW